jgi:hypothetical protein
MIPFRVKVDQRLLVAHRKGIASMIAQAQRWEQVEEHVVAELRQVWEAARHAGSGDEVEAAVQAWQRETGAWVMATLCQQAIEQQERQASPQCCGQRMDLHSRQARQVTTLLGTVGLRRRYYRCLQCGRSHYPADAWLGWQGGFSFGVQELVAWECAALPYREALASLEKLAGVVVGKHAALDIAARWGKEGLPATPYRERVAQDLIIEIDGTTVHLEEGWKELKVGAFFSWDRFAPEAKPQAVSYVADWRSAEQFKELLDEEALVRGAPTARSQVVLGDGAAWVWETASHLFPQAVQILDWYHLSQHLWTAAKVVHGEGSEATQGLARSWEGEVRAGRSEGVEEHLRELVGEGQDDGEHTLRKGADYLQTHQHRIRYHLFEAMGLPIGSGVVEGACKQVVGLRFKRKSTRWGLPGGRAILHLRLDRLNGRWPLRMQHLRKAA